MRKRRRWSHIIESVDDKETFMVSKLAPQMKNSCVWSFYFNKRLLCDFRLLARDLKDTLSSAIDSEFRQIFSAQFSLRRRLNESHKTSSSFFLWFREWPPRKMKNVKQAVKTPVCLDGFHSSRSSAFLPRELSFETRGKMTMSQQ